MALRGWKPAYHSHGKHHAVESAESPSACGKPGPWLTDGRAFPGSPEMVYRRGKKAVDRRCSTCVRKES